MTLKYQILDAGKWITCSKAVVNPKGWLEYQLRSGDQGIMPPSKRNLKWRPSEAVREPEPEKA